jgi:hypothetical protein
MKLIPFLRFGNARGDEEDNEDNDGIDLPPQELVEPPSDEETEQAEDEEKPEDEKPEENGDDKPMTNDDEMLKAFMSVGEEFVDDSGLASQLEDVPAEELLQELRIMASAFGIRVTVPEDETV